VKPRSLMLTLFGEYIEYYGGEIWVGSLVKLMEKFGISESSVRGAIFRMVKQGYLQKRKVNHKSYYSLTEKERRDVKDGVWRVYSTYNYSWDNKWRILSYSFPEEKREIRNEIRKTITWLGLGQVSNSTWLTPRPVEDRIKDLMETYDEYGEHIVFFSSASLLSHTTEDIIHKGWDLESVSKHYDVFIEEYTERFQKLREQAFNNDLSDEQCYIERTSLVHEYRKFLFDDPVFPQELLPTEWSGTKAHQLFEEIHQLLAMPSVRYFESALEGSSIINPTIDRYRAMNPFFKEGTFHF